MKKPVRLRYTVEDDCYKLASPIYTLQDVLMVYITTSRPSVGMVISADTNSCIKVLTGYDDVEVKKKVKIYIKEEQGIQFADEVRKAIK